MLLLCLAQGYQGEEPTSETATTRFPSKDLIVDVTGDRAVSSVRWHKARSSSTFSALCLGVVFFVFCFFLLYVLANLILLAFYLSRIPQNDWSTCGTFHSIPVMLCFCFHIAIYNFSHFISFDGGMGPVCQLDDIYIKLLILFHVITN